MYIVIYFQENYYTNRKSDVYAKKNKNLSLTIPLYFAVLKNHKQKNRKIELIYYGYEVKEYK